MDGLVAVLNTFADALVVCARQYVELWRPFLLAVHETMRDVYQDAGAPYGDTHDGMLRFFREQMEAERLRARAEAIDQRHRDLAAIRQWGKDMRARRAERAAREACDGMADGS